MAASVKSDLVEFGKVLRPDELSRNEYVSDTNQYSDNANVKNVTVDNVLTTIETSYSNITNENPGQVVIY
jgi:hypothetical protein